MVVRAKVIANAKSQLLRRQDAAMLGHCSLAMHPLRFDVVQPWAFGRQQARDNLNAFLTLSPTSKHLPIVFSYPVVHFPADVPGSVIPDEHQHSLAFLSQPLAHPFQVSGAHMTDRPSIDEAQ